MSHRRQPTHTAPQRRRNPRIAIIGSGLTGLAAAHFLTTPQLHPLHTHNDDDHEAPEATSTSTSSIEVDLFERAPRLGMDASSISVTDPSSQRDIRIDVPMRAFNSGYYPELLALYRRLGIPARPSDFTYSFAIAAHHKASLASSPSSAAAASTTTAPIRAPSPSFIYLGSSGARGARMPTALKRTIPSFRMLDARRAWAGLLALTQYTSQLTIYILGYFYFLTLALWHSWWGHTRDPSHPLARLTLDGWAKGSGASGAFIEDILIPILSATQTAPERAIRNTPAAEVLEFTAMSFGAKTYTVGTGIHSVVSALTAQMEPAHIHLNSTIVEMRPSVSVPGTVLLKVAQRSQSGAGEAGEEVVRDFDGYTHLIFALQANQTVPILRNYEKQLANDAAAGDDNSAQEQTREHLRETIAQLEKFPYERSVVINHTDTRLLPPEGDRCDLNMVSPAAAAAAAAGVANDHTYHANGHLPHGVDGSEEDDDEDAVDALLRGASNHVGPSAHAKKGRNGAAMASGGADQSEYDVSLVAPEGCTMATHLIKHYTRPITLPSSSSSSSASTRRQDGGGVAESLGARFPDLPILEHGRQELNETELEGRHGAHRATRVVDEVQSNGFGNGGGLHPDFASSEKGAGKGGGPAGGEGDGDGEGESVLFMQTTNPMAPYLPRPDLTLSISHFERVVLTLGAKAAQAHFYRWARSPLPQKTRSSGDVDQKGKENGKDGAGALVGQGLGSLWTRGRAALHFRSPRSQWKVTLGDLQLQGLANSRNNSSEHERGRPAILLAGSWGPPAIPLLEGCVTSARLVVSELLRREGLASAVCEELAGHAM